MNCQAKKVLEGGVTKVSNFGSIKNQVWEALLDNFLVKAMNNKLFYLKVGRGSPLRSTNQDIFY
uniref:Uncharacterized protein n=1 Tax=Leersia perrieri TaxID=77586 RepID=A0A0D9W3V6_9ORYZ